MSNDVRHLKIQRFGEKLRALRERSKLNHADLAHALGYASTNQIYQLEAGKRNPTADLILKVSKLFHVSADDLIDDERELAE